MSIRAVLELYDLDMLREMALEPQRMAKLRRAGYAVDGEKLLDRERVRLAGLIERRWLSLYDRSHARYGRGITLVRDRVCQGCYMTLPMSAAPAPGESLLHLCESCGRLLYWR